MKSMLHPIAFHFVGGDAFFSGAALLVLAGGLALLPHRMLYAKTAIRLVAFLGAILVALAAVPLAPWFYGLWAAVGGGWILSAKPANATGRKRRQRGCSLVFVVISLIALASEARFHIAEERPQSTFSTLYVIGDSLSAPAELREDDSWPERIAAERAVNVINLARVGETTRSAVAQAENVRESHAIVLIEIGGNDLLSGVPTAQFARDLEELLSALNHPQRRLVMLELPLPPFYNGYGRAQRKLAKRFNVQLIPRRALAGVLFTNEATVDGLHLSASGQELMARTVWNSIGPMLRTKEAGFRSR